MAIEIKTPQQVADEYLIHLKSLKPSINIDQEDSDWWVRSRVVGGVLSGVHSDIRKISNDAFPQSARRDALEQHLITYFGSGFRPATKAIGNLAVTGTIGSSTVVGDTLTHESTGKQYKVTANTTLSATAGQIPVESVLTGSDQNLLTGTTLVFGPVPSGFEANTVVVTPGLTDARDEETNEEAAERILDRIRSPIRGGTETDYKQWAIEADPSVLDATVKRFPEGLGTVQVLISAGTSDIDEAIDTGSPITVTPSLALVDAVYEYIDGVNPLTDCISVSGAVPVSIDVTVNVHFNTGDQTTVITGASITQGEAVKREVQRAIYKTPIGGRMIGASGYILASEIEEMIDFNLSKSPITLGSKYQIVVDRQCQDLAASGPNRYILNNQIAIPGTITVVDI